MAKYHEDLLFYSGVSFSLSLLNLLPARNLDGGRILLALLSRLKNEDFAERVVCLSSCLVSFAMLVLGWFILIYTRGNFSFLLVGIWLLFDIARMSLRG
jgi:stage IV sporulation protein FB